MRPAGKVQNGHRLLFEEAMESPPDDKATSDSWGQIRPWGNEPRI